MKQHSKKKQQTSTKKSVHPAAWIVSGIAVIIAGYMIVQKINRDPLSSTGQSIEAMADAGQGSGSGAFAPDAQIEDLHGNMVKLSNYRGSVVMINFWATWCGPCKAEIPDFIDLQDKYGDDGLEIVGISLDKPGKENAVRAFVKAKGINYDVLFGDGAVTDAYGGVRSIPTTFLIDREGQIKAKHVGLRSKDVLESAIKQLL